MYKTRNDLAADVRSRVGQLLNSTRLRRARHFEWLAVLLCLPLFYVATVLLNKALTETNAAKRKAMYQRANRMIMNFLPGVPYAHTKPALGFQTNVVGYKPSPVTLESFAPVRFIG